MVRQVMRYYKIPVGSHISSRLGAELKKPRKDYKMKVLSLGNIHLFVTTSQQSVSDFIKYSGQGKFCLKCSEMKEL